MKLYKTMNIYKTVKYVKIKIYKINENILQKENK